MSKRLNLGHISLPKAIREPRTVPPSEAGPGNNNHTTIEIEKEDEDFDPRCEERDPRITFKWDEVHNRLLINPVSNHYKRYWDYPVIANSTYEKMLNNLWSTLNCLAGTIYRSCKSVDYSMGKPSSLPERYHTDFKSRNNTDEDHDGSEPWDYLINESLDVIISDDGPNNEILKLLKDIEKQIERHNLQQEEVTQEEAA